MKKHFFILFSLLLSCQNIPSNNKIANEKQEKVRLSFLSKQEFSKKLTEKGYEKLNKSKSLEIMNKYKNKGSKDIIINENIKPFLEKNVLSVKGDFPTGPPDENGCIYYSYCYYVCDERINGYCIRDHAEGCLECDNGSGDGGNSNNNEDPITLSLDKTIVSTKNVNNVSFTVTVGSNKQWSITSNTNFTRSGTGSETFLVSNTELGTDLQDGNYNFTLSSDNKTVISNLSIDNTPPKIKTLEILAEGKVNITTEDPVVNGVSSGVEPSNQTIVVNYGNNKQASLSFSIASLNAKQTGNILEKSDYSIDIKDKVGNVFKFTNNCIDNSNTRQKEVEKKTKEFEKLLEKKKIKMDNLTSNLSSIISEYNSLVSEDKELGSKLIEYGSLLDQYQSKRDQLVNADNPDVVSWTELISNIELLQIKIENADLTAKELKNKIANADKKSTTIKNEISELIEEIEVIKNEINNTINSLNGLCIASASDTLSKLGGPITVAADKLIQLGLLGVNLYTGYVINESIIYSNQQAIISKELREKANVLAKESKKSDKEDKNDVPDWSEGINNKVAKEHPDWTPERLAEEVFKRAGKTIPTTKKDRGPRSEFSRIRKRLGELAKRYK